MAEEEAALDTLEGEGEGEEDPVRSSTSAQHHCRRQNLVTPGQGETCTSSLRNNKQKAYRAASAWLSGRPAGQRAMLTLCLPSLLLSARRSSRR